MTIEIAAIIVLKNDYSNLGLWRLAIEMLKPHTGAFTTYSQAAKNILDKRNF